MSDVDGVISHKHCRYFKTTFAKKEEQNYSTS